MRRTTAGFTLIEVAIAVVILSISLLIVPYAGIRFTRAVSTNRVRNEANAIADAWIARCRLEPNYIALDSTGTGKCKGTVQDWGPTASPAPRQWSVMPRSPAWPIR